MNRNFIFALCAAAASLTAGFTGWRGEGQYSADKFKLEKNLFKAVPVKGKHISVLQTRSETFTDGMKIAWEAEVSGRGKIIFGVHLYQSGNQWIGLCKSPVRDIDSERFQKITQEMTVRHETALRFRPFVRVLGGSAAIKNLKWRIVSRAVAEHRLQPAAFKGWIHASGSAAEIIRLQGDGSTEKSVLSVRTGKKQQLELMGKIALKVTENDAFKFRFDLSGPGKVVWGLHLYDKSRQWQGLVSAVVSAGKKKSVSEVNFNVKTPAGKNPIVYVRPFFRVPAEQRVDIGHLHIKSRSLVFRKPEVELPLADGFELIHQKRGDFPLRFFASENKIVLDEVEKPYDTYAAKVVSARFTAVGTGGKKWGEGVFAFQNGLICNQSFALDKTLTGSFRVQAEYMDKNGKVLGTGQGFSAVPHMDLYSGRYMVGGFRLENAHLKEWVKSYLMGQRVFYRQNYPFEKTLSEKHGYPNFSPVRIKKDQLLLDNRVYTIGRNGFLKQANSLQTEPTVGEARENLLASSVELLVDGKKLDWDRTPLKVQEGAAVWSQKAVWNNSRFFIQNQLEPDGALKMVISFEAGQDLKVRNVALEIPVRLSQATLYQNITDVTYRRLDRSKRLGKTPLGGFAGLTPEKKIRGNIVWESKGQERKMAGSFQPFVWLGNEDRGFCYFSDSDRDWIVDDSRSAIELARDGKSVICRLNFINTSDVLPQKKMKWTVGLMATPVKKPFARWRGTIFPRWMTMDKKFYSQLNKVRKIVMVSAGHPVFNAGTQSIISGDIQRTAKAYQELKDQYQSTYLEYYCSDELNINVQEIKTYFSEWAVAAAGSGTYSKSKRIKSKSYDFRGATSIYMQRISPSYLKYRNWAIGQKLAKVGLLAFYEDNLHFRGYNDPYRKLGFLDSKGRQHYDFDLWSLRDYFHQLAGQYRKNGFENLTGAHGSASLLIPALANCTFFIDGEQPGRYDNTDDLDYIDRWRDLDYIRAVSMGRAFGINTIFLSEMFFPGKDADGKHTRAWLALILPHDIAPWDGTTKNRAPVRAWHKIVNDLEFYADHPVMYPYWAKGKHKVFEHGHKDLLVTVFKQSKRLVVLLSNMGEKGTFNIRLLADRLKVKKLTALTDLESSEKISAKDGRFSVQIPRHDFRVFAAE